MIDKDFELYLLNKYMKASDILFRDGIFHSKGEMRRSIIQSVIKINGELVTDVDQEFMIGKDVAIQRGNKKYFNGKEWRSLEIDPVKIVLFGRIEDHASQETIDSYEKFTGGEYFPKNWQ